MPLYKFSAWIGRQNHNDISLLLCSNTPGCSSFSAHRPPSPSRSFYCVSPWAPAWPMARWYGLLSLWLQAHLTNYDYQEICLQCSGPRRQATPIFRGRESMAMPCASKVSLALSLIICPGYEYRIEHKANCQSEMLFTSDPKVSTSRLLCCNMLTIYRHCNIFLIHLPISLVNFLKTARPLHSPPVKALSGLKVVLIVVGNIYHLTCLSLQGFNMPATGKSWIQHFRTAPSRGFFLYFTTLRREYGTRPLSINLWR